MLKFNCLRASLFPWSRIFLHISKSRRKIVRLERFKPRFKWKNRMVLRACDKFTGRIEGKYILAENLSSLNHGKDFVLWRGKRKNRRRRGRGGAEMQFFDQMPPCVFPVVNATIYNVTKVDCMRPCKQDCRPDARRKFFSVLSFPIFPIVNHRFSTRISITIFPYFYYNISFSVYDL